MKAILVIDMPTDCNECPCYYEEAYRCQVHMETDEDLYDGKPSWCPLKPMLNDYPPYTKIREQNFYTEEESDAYEKGWNDCLEEIQK